MDKKRRSYNKNYSINNGDYLKPIMVKPRDNSGEALEYALKLFKRKIKDLKILVEVQNKTYYRKPSEIKREKRKKAINRMRREVELLKMKENKNVCR